MRSMGARFQLAERGGGHASPGQPAMRGVPATPPAERPAQDAALDQPRALRRLALVVEAEAGELLGPRQGRS